MSSSNSAWTPSTREEVIAALWTMVAVLTWGFQFPSFVCWVFTLKAGADILTSLVLSRVEYKEEKKSASPMS